MHIQVKHFVIISSILQLESARYKHKKIHINEDGFIWQTRENNIINQFQNLNYTVIKFLFFSCLKIKPKILKNKNQFHILIFQPQNALHVLTNEMFSSI